MRVPDIAWLIFDVANSEAKARIEKTRFDGRRLRRRARREGRHVPDRAPRQAEKACWMVVVQAYIVACVYRQNLLSGKE